MTGIIFVCTIMAYNSIRLYHSTQLAEYLFYPVTGIFFILIASIVGNQAQQIYTTSAEYIDDSKRNLHLKSPSRRATEIECRVLSSLQPFGLEFGSLLKFNQGFTQAVLAILLDQTINLLISFP